MVLKGELETKERSRAEQSASPLPELGLALGIALLDRMKKGQSMSSESRCQDKLQASVLSGNPPKQPCGPG